MSLIKYLVNKAHVVTCILADKASGSFVLSYVRKRLLSLLWFTSKWNYPHDDFKSSVTLSLDAHHTWLIPLKYFNIEILFKVTAKWIE